MRKEPESDSNVLGRLFRRSGCHKIDFEVEQLLAAVAVRPPSFDLTFLQSKIDFQNCFIV